LRHVFWHPPHSISGFLQDPDQRIFDQPAQNLGRSAILVYFQVVVVPQLRQSTLEVLLSPTAIDLALGNANLVIHLENPPFGDFLPRTASLV